MRWAGLKRRSGLLKERVVDREKDVVQYLQAIRIFQLDETLTQAALQQNQTLLAQQRQTVSEQFEAAENETLDAKSRQLDAEKQVNENFAVA